MSTKTDVSNIFIIEDDDTKKKIKFVTLNGNDSIIISAYPIEDNDISVSVRYDEMVGLFMWLENVFGLSRNGEL